MKKLFQIAFLILGLATYLLYLNRYSFIVASSSIGLETTERYFDYKGITHVHSILSTGSGSPSEIVRLAHELKFDFVIFTELNLYEHDQPIEGYFNNVLAMEGGEYSYLDSRLLYYNRPPHQPPTGKGQAQVFFADLLSQHPRPQETGFLVLAHPLHTRYPWTGEYPKGLDGIEVINLKRILENAWQEKRFTSLYSILTYPFNPHASLLRIYKDPVDEQELWDKLNREKKTIALLGTDATAKAIIMPGFYFKFPSYETAFSAASNHILLRSELTGDFKSDKLKIMNALRNGQSYMSLDILGNPEGFWAEVRSQGKAYLFGQEIKASNDLQMVVHLPTAPLAPYEIRLIKDGELLALLNSVDATVSLPGPGVYRLVVRILVPLPFPEGKKWIPWIYSNPFYIK